MAELDHERLEEVLVLIERRGNLRQPQREALAALELAFQQAGTDLHEQPNDVATAFQQMAGFSVSESGMAEGDFALATGAGKSRLAGAVIELMANAGLSKTFMVLSHRELLNRRWRWALESNAPNTVVPLMRGRADYAVIDSAVDLGAYASEESIIVIAQTVQAISNPRSHWWQDALSNLDLRQWIRERDDLVIIFDESHHLQGDGSAKGWRAALDGLHAKLILGLTATPRGNRHVIYEYSLSRLLVEGKYSKRVSFMVETLPATTRNGEDDRIALDVGLQLLEAKRAYVSALPREHPLSSWSPAMLVAAASIQEVQEVKDTLVSDMGIDPTRVLAIASGVATDSDLEKILNFDDSANREVDIVIAAFMLDEGWDVNRIAVIVPLRALSSIPNAKQIIGRGLRLPAGKRLNEDELDTLEVVIVGQATLLEIKHEVETAFGQGAATVVSRRGTESRPGGSRFVDREDGGPVQRFTVLLERRGIGDVKLPLLVPANLHMGTPPSWQTEAVNLNLTRIAAESGSLSVASGIELQYNVSDVVQRVAERVDFVTPRVIVEVLESWSRSTGKDLPEALSVSAVEALTREALDCSWFDWRDGGLRWLLTPEQVRTTSDVDPTTAINKGQPWARKRWWKGWEKSVYDLVRLDSNPEYKAAHILDSAQNVKWWIRNDPKLLRISLPSQRFAPDFIVRTQVGVIFLEIKGDNQFDDFLSVALCKTMEHWVVSLQNAMRDPVRFETVKSTEVESVLLARLAAD
jgi:hypothetical protein